MFSTKIKFSRKIFLVGNLLKKIAFLCILVLILTNIFHLTFSSLPVLAQFDITESETDPLVKIWNYTANDIIVSVCSVSDITNDGLPEVVAGSQSTSDSTVYMIDGATGEKLWHYNKWESFWEVLREVKCIPDVTDDNVSDILVACLGGVYILDGLCGKRVWWYTDLGGWVSTDFVPDVTGDGKPEIITGSTFEVHLLDIVNDKILWHFYDSSMDDTLVTYVPDVTGDNIPDVAVGSDNNMTYLLSGSDGKSMWKFKADGRIQSITYRPGTLGDEIPNILVGSAKGTVYLINGRNGDEIWHYKAGDSITRRDGIVCIPDVTSDGKTEVVVGSHDYCVYLLDGTSGELVWFFKTQNKVESVAYSYDIDGDKTVYIIVGSKDKKVYMLSAANRSVLWKFQTDGYVYSVSNISDVSGDGHPDVIAGSSDHRIYCLSGYSLRSPAIVIKIESNPIKGVPIEYRGDFVGTETTDFSIGPEASPFMLTLTAPLTYEDYSFNHWIVDGSILHEGNEITLTVDRDRTAVAVYVEHPGRAKPYFMAGVYLISDSSLGTVPVYTRYVSEPSFYLALPENQQVKLRYFGHLDAQIGEPLPDKKIILQLDKNIISSCRTRKSYQEIGGMKCNFDGIISLSLSSGVYVLEFKFEGDETYSQVTQEYFIVVYKSSGFNITRDAYKFSNWGFNFVEYLSLITELLNGGIVDTALYYPILCLYPIFSGMGHCFGMAASSSAFYMNPSLKPKQMDTYEFDKNDVYLEVNWYQLQQVRWLFHESDITTSIETVKSLINSGEPVIMGFRFCDELPPKGHAVAIIGYCHNKDGTYFVIYDNNAPNTTTLCKVKEGKMIWELNYITSASFIPPNKLQPLVKSNRLNEAIKEIFNKYSGFLWHSPVDVRITSQSGKELIVEEDNVVRNDFTESYIYLDDQVKIILLPSNDTYFVEASA
ncbi:hypothetical protein DRO69_11580, partial [Candidatus Bathyarchaeota archaeon]